MEMNFFLKNFLLTRQKKGKKGFLMSKFWFKDQDLRVRPKIVKILVFEFFQVKIFMFLVSDVKIFQFRDEKLSKFRF